MGTGLKLIFDRLRPYPMQDEPTSSVSTSSYQQNQGACVPCASYQEVVNAWKKTSKWTWDLDCGLSVMLATSVSTPFVGEQLWFLIQGPPGSFKTSLVEGLALDEEHMLSRDSIRGLHSGWKTPDGEDISVAKAAEGKTLAIKDGDTLLKAPNLTQILSEFRAMYDRVSRVQYRNDVQRDYTGHRMTVLICGTKALREIDDSEVGARFLNCQVMESIDDEHEKEVGRRAAFQELRNLRLRSDGQFSSQHAPEMALAMGLTGGYLQWLHRRADDLLGGLADLDDEDVAEQVNKLGRFVAHMRARPSKSGADDATREFAPRLVKQLSRAAAFLACVLGEKSIASPEVQRRLLKVTLDTARGPILETVRALYDAGHAGSSVGALAAGTRRTADKVGAFVTFLDRLKMVECFHVGGGGPFGHQTRWRLSAELRELYEKVVTQT